MPPKDDNNSIKKEIIWDIKYLRRSNDELIEPNDDVSRIATEPVSLNCVNLNKRKEEVDSEIDRHLVTAKTEIFEATAKVPAIHSDNVQECESENQVL